MDMNTPVYQLEPEQLRIVLVDDEPLAIRRLHSMLVDIGCKQIAAEFNSGESCLRYLQTNTVDVLFLDMHLPRLSGLQLIEKLNQLPSAPSVVVVTAWMEHALEAYGPSTVAYLLKPISSHHLVEAIDKVLVRIRQRHTQEVMNDGYDHLARLSLTVNENRVVRKIRTGDISFFKAQDKYVRAHTRNQSTFWLNDTLNSLLDRLEPLFVRIHRNAAVNRREVVCLYRGRGSQLTGHWSVGIYGFDEKLDVSRSHHREVRKLFRLSDAE